MGENLMVKENDNMYNELIETPEITNIIMGDINKRISASNGFRTCEKIFKIKCIPEPFTVGKELSANDFKKTNKAFTKRLWSYCESSFLLSQSTEFSCEDSNVSSISLISSSKLLKFCFLSSFNHLTEPCQVELRRNFISTKNDCCTSFSMTSPQLFPL